MSCSSGNADAAADASAEISISGAVMLAADALDSLARPGGEPDPGGDIDIILCRCQLSFAKLSFLEDLIACKLSSDNGL